MGSKNSDTSTSTSAPPPEVMANYNRLTSQANNLASQPYTPYNGSLVAGFTPQQQAAFSNINSAAGVAQPYIGQAAKMVQAATSGVNPAGTVAEYSNPNIGNFLNPAASYAQNAAQGIDPLHGDLGVQSFMNPYTQNVVQAQQALQNEQDGEQQAQLVGNAAAQGAFGGDRSAIAQSVLARQQALANNMSNANVLQSGYQNAMQQAIGTQNTNAGLGLQSAGMLGNLGNLSQNAYQQALGMGLSSQEANAWLNSQGAFALGQLGSEAQNEGMAGAQAQLGIGNQMQNQAQTVDNTNYGQFLQAQSYPFQTLNWNAQIDSGLGSQMGGTSTTTQPGPSMLSQLGGLGMAGYGAYLAFAKRGGAIDGYADGGGTGGMVEPLTDTIDYSSHWGTPLSAHGAGPPKPPNPTQQQDPMQAGLGIAKGLSMFGGSDGGQPADALAYAAAMNPTDPNAFGPGFDQGGGVSPYIQASFGGGNPMMSGLLQRYQQLPTEKLREMGVMYGGGSPQGSIIQALLRQREMQPQADPTQQQQPMTPMQGMSGLGAPTPGMPGMRRGGFARFDDGGDVPQLDPLHDPRLDLDTDTSSPWWDRYGNIHEPERAAPPPKDTPLPTSPGPSLMETNGGGNPTPGWRQLLDAGRWFGHQFADGNTDEDARLATEHSSPVASETAGVAGLDQPASAAPPASTPAASPDDIAWQSHDIPTSQMGPEGDANPDTPDAGLAAPAADQPARVSLTAGGDNAPSLDAAAGPSLAAPSSDTLPPATPARRPARGTARAISPHIGSVGLGDDLPTPPIPPAQQPPAQSSVLADRQPAGLGAPAVPHETQSKFEKFIHSPGAALMMAGLGMMSSRSPFPLVALGQGGQQAVGFMGNVARHDEDIAARRAQAQMAHEMQMQRLQDNRDFHQGMLALGDRRADTSAQRAQAYAALAMARAAAAGASKETMTNVYREAEDAWLKGHPGANAADAYTALHNYDARNSQAEERIQQQRDAQAQRVEIQLLQMKAGNDRALANTARGILASAWANGKKITADDALAMARGMMPGSQPANPTVNNPTIAPPPMNQRVKGQSYPTPKGPMTWTGTGWVPTNG